MDKLFEIFSNNILNLKIGFKRYLFKEIDWSNRLIAITGSRGVGKTTMILQYIKENYELNESVLYTSLDNIYFTANSLINLVDIFVKNGGKYLFLDEVHKYPNWSLEIKNTYDNFPELKIVFTGSSILNIYRGFADLSRRAVSYNMIGLSFREYLELEKAKKFPALTLNDIIKNQQKFSKSISSEVKPIAEFKNYLKYGYYPYYKENKNLYFQKLSNTINVILENDLPSVYSIEYKNINKLQKLLFIIATSVPFKANVSKLADRTGVSRNTIIQFFDFLSQAQIINYLNTASKGLGYLSKPEKIFLNNTNLMYALSPENVNSGNMRETFFLNQVLSKHIVNLSKESDFLVDDKYTFEIGGRNKKAEQIKGVENSFLVLDDIEFGYKNTIPLWLFGFLY